MKLQIKWTFNIRNCVASYKVKRRVVFKVLAVVSSCYSLPMARSYALLTHQLDNRSSILLRTCVNVWILCRGENEVNTVLLLSSDLTIFVKERVRCRGFESLFTHNRPKRKVSFPLGVRKS